MQYSRQSHFLETDVFWFDTGVVASPTDRLVPAANRNGAMEDELPEEPVKILESQATFDNFVVWGHEIPPAADDTFVKGVDEWINLAEAVWISCSFPILRILILYRCTENPNSRKRLRNEFLVNWKF